MIDPLFAHLTAVLDQAAPHRTDPAAPGYFQCGSCLGEWVIANPPKHRTWHCPWCSHYARTTPAHSQEDLPDGD